MPRRLFAIVFCLLMSGPVFARFDEDASASTSRVCLVTLLRNQAEFKIIEREFEAQSGHSFAGLGGRLDVFDGSARAIRSCLEGEYAEVVVIAHSAMIASDRLSLVYSTLTPQGEPTQVFLSERVFSMSRISPRLKRVSIATCHPELMRMSYPGLFESAESKGFRISLAEADIASGNGEGGVTYTSARSAVSLLIEALSF